jgi:hypothetical protein
LQSNYHPTGIGASTNCTIIILHLNEMNILKRDFIEGGAILERQEIVFHTKRFGNWGEDFIRKLQQVFEIKQQLKIFPKASKLFPKAVFISKPDIPKFNY